jgi:hypothetical protein
MMLAGSGLALQNGVQGGGGINGIQLPLTLAGPAVSLVSGTGLWIYGPVGEFGGSRGLSVVGPGWVTFFADATFTGPLTVYSGSAVIQSDFTSSSGVWVQSGAGLSGAGTLAGGPRRDGRHVPG